MTRTAEDNAVEFARHTKYEGWALGLLVACSVERGAGQGQPRNDRYEVGKISAQAFARKAETSAPRVLRYLDAWEAAANKRVVPPASKLTPDDVDAYELPEGYNWSEFYDGGTDDGVKRHAHRWARTADADAIDDFVAQLPTAQIKKIVAAAAEHLPALAAGRDTAPLDISNAPKTGEARLNRWHAEGKDLWERYGDELTASQRRRFIDKHTTWVAKIASADLNEEAYQ